MLNKLNNAEKFQCQCSLGTGCITDTLPAPLWCRAGSTHPKCSWTAGRAAAADSSRCPRPSPLPRECFQTGCGATTPRLCYRKRTSSSCKMFCSKNPNALTSLWLCAPTRWWASHEEVLLSRTASELWNTQEQFTKKRDWFNEATWITYKLLKFTWTLVC